MVIVGFIQFVQPALLAGAGGAVLIPLIIHLINRRRFKRVPWAAMSFLLAAAKRSARRIQLEQWSLLLIRMLILLILGLLLARPYFRQEALAAISGSRAHHLLIIDNSASLNARLPIQGAVAVRSEFDRAKQIALDLIRSFVEQDSISIITASAPAAGILAYECYDHRLAQDQIQAMKPTYRNNDVAGALAMAERLVDESSSVPGNAIVYVISDHAVQTWDPSVPVDPANGVETGSPPSNGSSSSDSSKSPDGRDSLAVSSVRRLAEKARVLLIRTSTYNAAANLGPVALTGLLSRSSLPGVNLPLRFEARVTNYGSTSTGPRVMEVKRDGQVIKEIPVDPIAAGESGSTAFSLAMAQAGSHALESGLTGPEELLPEAATRRTSLMVPKDISVLIVDGKPGITPLAGYSGYLAAAWAAYTSPDSAPLFETKVISDLEAGNEVLDEHAMIVLAGVGQVSESLAARLTSYVTDGGSILVFMGEGIVPARYNELLYADGKGWFPGKLEEFVGDESIEFQGRSLRSVDKPHPLVADFTDLDQSGLFQARFRKYARLTPFKTPAVEPADVPTRDLTRPPLRLPPAEVVMTLDNDDPLLVVRPFGNGRTAVFASTANMDWNNLPAKGDFVSLMINLAAYLCPPSGAGRTLEAGQTFRERLTPSEAGSGVELLSPTHQKIATDVECNAQQCELNSDPLDELGFYRLRTRSGLNWVAVNFPVSEADLRPLAASDAEAMFGDGVEWVDNAGLLLRRVAQGRTTEVGGPLLFLLIGLLITEGWLAMRYGIHR